MTKRTDARKQFLTDVLTTAVEGGINYWSQVSDYEWDVPLGEARVTVWDIEGVDNADDAVPVKVTIETIARGIGVLNKRNDYHRGYFNEFWAANHTNGEEGDYDASVADAVLQAGIFGDVIYG